MTVQLLQKPTSKGILLFLLAFLSRCIYIIYQPLIDTDYQLIHVAAGHFQNGDKGNNDKIKKELYQNQMAYASEILFLN